MRVHSHSEFDAFTIFRQVGMGKMKDSRQHSIKNKYDCIKDITTWVWEQAADFQFQKFSKCL